jgi:STAS-like domain of unknown function (DUF4325)
MKIISIFDKAGNFAENKDIARDIRLNEITPAYKNQVGDIILDFEGVTGATQSFVHAMISQLIREYGDSVFTRLVFKNCNEAVQEIINIVADYMAES